MRVVLLLAVVLASLCAGQRIHTVEVGNSRYFVSNASPYSPQLNWFLAYQYCRTIGMELLSLERQEEVHALDTFLQETTYGRNDYWTSGNQLGSAMWIWMSTGQPFNVTFSYWSTAGPPLTKTQQACVSTRAGTWTAQNCMDSKPFICEQTRCFYYNYVTSNRATPKQGNSTIVPGVTGILNRSPSSSLPLARPLRRTPPISGQQQQSKVQVRGQNVAEAQQQQSPALLKIMATTTPPPALTTTPTTSPPLKTMPLTSASPLKVMPTTQTLKTMPTTSSPVSKIMPTAGTTLKPMPITLKSMPTTAPPPKSMPTTLKSMPSATPEGMIKVMPTAAPEGMIKVMPTAAPKGMIKVMPTTTPGRTTKVMPVTAPSAENLNNEILPISPLKLMLPPQHEFTPSFQPGQTPASNKTLSELLSRKETFSWALLDGDSK